MFIPKIVIISGLYQASDNNGAAERNPAEEGSPGPPQ